MFFYLYFMQIFSANATIFKKKLHPKTLKIYQIVHAQKYSQKNLSHAKLLFYDAVDSTPDLFGY